MIFIGGISPKTKVLSERPEICPVCGLAQAYYKRVDHYLSLFFIPLVRFKKGEPFLMCERCERSVHEMGDEYSGFLEKQDARCRHCGRAIHPEFKYCPHCGKPV